MHSIVRDVVVTNCVIYESNRAFAIMASSGTGLVENVTVSNMRLDTQIRAGNWWGNGEPICIMAVKHHLYRDNPPARHFPVNMRNIQFNNIICSGENAIGIIGENNNMENIRLDNICFTLKDSENLPLKGCMIDIAPGEQTAVMPDDNKPYWLFAKQAGDIKVGHVSTVPYHGIQPEIYYER
jgi:hypothetical protein